MMDDMRLVFVPGSGRGGPSAWTWQAEPGQLDDFELSFLSHQVLGDDPEAQATVLLVFRFNRRSSRSRGLLFQRLLQEAVEGDALAYNELRKACRTRPPPPPPVRARTLPPTLELGESGLPWRADEN